MIGVITAAGFGVRLHPNTTRIQKSLLEIDGEPILKRNISIMRDQMGIELIYILVGYKKEQVTSMFGNGKKNISKDKLTGLDKLDYNITISIPTSIDPKIEVRAI